MRRVTGYEIEDKGSILSRRRNLPFVKSQPALRALSQNYEKRLTFIMSVRPSAWNNSAPTGRIFVKFIIRVSSESLS